MKVYNPYKHSVPLTVVQSSVDAEGKTVVTTTEVTLQPGANMDLKTHTLHASAKQRWPRLHITEDKPVVAAAAKVETPAPTTTAVAPAAAPAVEVAKDTKKASKE